MGFDREKVGKCPFDYTHYKLSTAFSAFVTQVSFYAKCIANYCFWGISIIILIRVW